MATADRRFRQAGRLVRRYRAGVTPTEFRQLATALPEVVESEHQGHPDFRVHGRVFASLLPDGARAMVKVPPAVQQRLVAAHGNVCAPANGAWGRAGCTLFVLALATRSLVGAALQEGWQFAAAGLAGKTTKRRRRT